MVKSAQKKRVKKTSVGGQAVIEGVMMRGKTSMVTSVRDKDGVIRVEAKRINKKPNAVLKLPIIRGCYAFVQSLVGGTKVLMRSAEVYGEDQPTKFDKWLSKTLKIDVMNVVAVISLVLGLALAIGLFLFLPQLLRGLIENLCGVVFSPVAKNFTEGGIKIVIFVGYLLLSSLLKDVRRTFMYHGAEHKTITCYEKGLPITVENAKKCKRVHDRCGTTFIIFVMLISILVFAGFEAVIGTSVTGALRVLVKIAFLPIVAGLSYELLKLLSKTDSVLVYPIKLPGLLLQKLTTKEPTDDMLEVAITSFNKVMEMDADESIPEKEFQIPEKMVDFTEKVYQKLKESGIEEKSEAEWIVSLSAEVKRSEVYSENLIFPSSKEKAEKIVNERITGRPLWYCVGNTEFYGYTVKVDERVLIPRPETELLVEQALKSIDKDKTVLDLCTGSGAIAIAIQKTSGALVTASDISEDALTLARENASSNGAEIEFVKSDMFDDLTGKFDVIVSNPPYIRKEDINSLQKEVKDFEPIIALDGGKDGLDFYRIIAKESKKFLNDKGVLFMEIGYNQSEDVVKMFSDYKFTQVIKDYEGVDRIIKVVL